jgi:hypothetical protein
MSTTRGGAPSSPGVMVTTFAPKLARQPYPNGPFVVFESAE